MQLPFKRSNQNENPTGAPFFYCDHPHGVVNWVERPHPSGIGVLRVPDYVDDYDRWAPAAIAEAEMAKLEEAERRMIDTKPPPLPLVADAPWYTWDSFD